MEDKVHTRDSSRDVYQFLAVEAECAYIAAATLDFCE